MNGKDTVMLVLSRKENEKTWIFAQGEAYSLTRCADDPKTKLMVFELKMGPLSLRFVGEDSGFIEFAIAGFDVRVDFSRRANFAKLAFTAPREVIVQRAELEESAA